MIAHIDLDCFFVSVARLINPALSGVPVAVIGGNNEEIFANKDEGFGAKFHFDESAQNFKIQTQKEQNLQNFADEQKRLKSLQKGVVLSASYEARKFGVHSAQPLKMALIACPELVLDAAKHGVYGKISNQIHKFLLNFTPEIEKFSVDEFFLDLRGTKYNENAREFALFLQSEIKAKFGLPSSVGLSEAKFIAKLATDLAKPFGVREIPISRLKTELRDVEISKFPGVGKSMQKTLAKYGIKSIGDAWGHREIFEKMGKNGEQIFAQISGDTSERVQVSRERKSIGLGRSFEPCFDRDEIKRRIKILSRHLASEVLEGGLNPLTYEVKIRYKSRDESSKRLSQHRPFSLDLLDEMALLLFEAIDVHRGDAIIHVSLNLSNFGANSAECATLLFDEIDKKRQNLDKSMNQIWSKFGVEKIKKASEI
ncbi:MAG: DNA polymerase IV [Campylobacter sp.]|nr:DNA polymerase IV [Campylobacter sp.]